jgi:hypothetical protein
MYNPLKDTYIEVLPETTEELIKLLQDKMIAYQSVEVDWVEACLHMKNPFTGRVYTLNVVCPHKDRTKPSLWFWKVWSIGTCHVATVNREIAVMMWESLSLSI